MTMTDDYSLLGCDAVLSDGCLPMFQLFRSEDQKKEAPRFFETLVNMYRTIRRHFTEYSNIHM
jgi:hypothetical protein